MQNYLPLVPLSLRGQVNQRMGDVDLSVIIVSYNTRDLLRRCLRSVLDNVKPGTWNLELTVVDNASTDGSAEMVRQEFPQVNLMASAENLGFVRGNNLALRQAQGRYLLLLNPDTEVQGDALATLLRFLDNHPQAGAVGPRLFYGDGALQHSAFCFPTLWQTYFDFIPWPARLLDSKLNGRYPRAAYDGPPFLTDFVLGACMMVRRRAVISDQGVRESGDEGVGNREAEIRNPQSAIRNPPVGLLDEDYFMYCEEMDWCRRLKAAGWEVWCVPQATVTHHEAQSSRQTRWPSYVVKWRSRFRFFSRYYPAWWQAVNRLLVRTGLWVEERRAREAHRRGEISAEQLQQQVEAYRQVGRL